MTDKEVGELWSLHHGKGNPAVNPDHRGYGIYGCSRCHLIRKLVEERKLIHKLNNLLGSDRDISDSEAEMGALYQLGIDPKEWKEKP